MLISCIFRYNRCLDEDLRDERNHLQMDLVFESAVELSQNLRCQ